MLQQQQQQQRQRQRQRQRQQQQHNNAIICICIISTFTSTVNTSIPTSEVRVGVKVGGHFLSPCCFSLSKGRWLSHLELQSHSVLVGVWCVLESQAFVEYKASSWQAVFQRHHYIFKKVFAVFMCLSPSLPFPAGLCLLGREVRLS